MALITTRLGWQSRARGESAILGIENQAKLGGELKHHAVAFAFSYWVIANLDLLGIH